MLTTPIKTYCVNVVINKKPTLIEVIFVETNFGESKNFAFSENLFSQIGFFEIFRGNYFSRISILKKYVFNYCFRF